MNEVTKARFGFLSVGAGILITAGLIGALMLTSGGGSAEEESVKTASPAPAVKQEAAKPEAPEKKTEESPSFWSRLFGRKAPEAAKTEEKKTAEKTAESVPQQETAPGPRYFRASRNPNFGKPFDYSHALRRRFANYEIGCGQNVGTGIMVDMNSRKVLWEYRSAVPVPVASMVKMMTMLITMEDLEKRKEISLSTPVRVTAAATKVPRTGVVWLDTRETFPLSALLKAVAIKSANDAAMQVAEFMGDGDIAKFIARMNSRAAELGMKNTNFLSACGLPDARKQHSVSSAADMTILAERLLEYPIIMRWVGTQQDSIRGGKTVLTTTNKLVNPHWPGVDGMKTGYTNAAGFCLTFSVLRGGRRIIGCVTGYKNRVERDRFCRHLIDWGYAQAAKMDASPTAMAEAPAKAAPVSSSKSTVKSRKKRRK